MTAAARNRIVGISVTVGLLVGWCYLTPRYVMKTFRVPTGSMKPAIPVGSSVFVRPTKDVDIGDIIAFHYPPKPDVWQVKRIVAGGGDTVEIREKRLLVNGAEKNEPYVVHEDSEVYPNQPSLPEPYRSRDWYGPYRVPANTYFVLGDNRDATADSRYWGVVPHENVFGRVVFVIAPDGFRRVPRPARR
jgi:signal peptidase I